MLAFALALLTALAIAAIAFPLLRDRPQAAQRAQYNLTVYRDQLAEIGREEARGALDAQQAASARIEVERRMLALAQQGETPAQASRGLRRAAFGLAVVLPLAALVWYFVAGRPELPARPFAQRDAASETTQSASRLLDELEARLQGKPDDLQGWALLGRTALRVGRFDQAATALARAIALAPERADLLSSYAEALILKDQGKVSARAREALDSALKLDPADVSAVYYRGLAEAQDGNPRAALQRWLDLEATAPAEAPWLAALQAEIERLARESGIDPQSLRPDRKPPAPPRGPCSSAPQHRPGASTPPRAARANTPSSDPAASSSASASWSRPRAASRRRRTTS